MGSSLPDDWKLRGQPRGGSTSPLEKYANFLLTLIEGQPDLTLDEVVCAMRKRTDHLVQRQIRLPLQSASAKSSHTSPAVRCCRPAAGHAAQDRPVSCSPRVFDR